MVSEKEWKETIKELKKKKIKINKEILKKKLVKKIENLIPIEKFGILFSGGVDSSFIALVCKKFKKDFSCYVVGLEGSKDVEYAKKVAGVLDLKLKVIELDLDEAEKVIKKTTRLLGTSDVTKVGVGAVVYAAMEQAKKDKVKYLFSGLGSEEIFAGYQRHELAKDVQEECWKGLELMYGRDLKRDFKISEFFEVGLLLPFLDFEVILRVMNVPGKKIGSRGNKLVLRDIAYEVGLDKEFAFRKKVAAQYGSGLDKAILKLAKKNGFKFKKDYLKSFLKPLGVLFSSGKDSVFSLFLMKKRGFSIKCLINIDVENEFSYMYHKPLLGVVNLQAESLDLPLVKVSSEGEKEKELKDLEKGLLEAKKKFKIEGVVTGALFSNYQKERVEKICKKLGLECFNPLWHKDQEELMRELVREDFEVIISNVAAEGFDSNWLGRKLDSKMIDELVKMKGINVAFEGGEAESLVLDCPLFKKKIKILEFEKKMDSSCSGKLVIEKVELISKS